MMQLMLLPFIAEYIIPGSWNDLAPQLPPFSLKLHPISLTTTHSLLVEKAHWLSPAGCISIVLNNTLRGV